MTIQINKEWLKNPICQNPKCTSGKIAVVRVGSIFVCGECVTRFNKNKNKMLFDIMNASYKEMLE